MAQGSQSLGDSLCDPEACEFNVQHTARIASQHWVWGDLEGGLLSKQECLWFIVRHCEWSILCLAYSRDSRGIAAAARLPEAHAHM